MRFIFEIPEKTRHCQSGASLFDLARACEQLNQPIKAVGYFERVLQLRPDDTQAHYHLYLLYSRNRQPAKAKDELAVCRKLVEMDKMGVPRGKRIIQCAES